jgi:hypothetical protein
MLNYCAYETRYGDYLREAKQNHGGIEYKDFPRHSLLSPKKNKSRIMLFIARLCRWIGKSINLFHS